MIIINNEDILRTKCEDVLPEEIGPLIDQLERELNRSNSLGNNGIGLAALQINIPKRAAIIRLGNNLNINLINCDIDKFYDSMIFRHEGCLSFPGRVEDTTRFQEIVIKNNLVEPYNFIATGLLAVVCQHEIDHWNGKIFTDYMIKNKPIVNKNKIKPNDPCVCGSIDPLTLKIKKYKKCCGK